MLAQMDALWLSSVVTDSQYARGVYEWKRRILRLAGQIRQMASRAVLAARRMEAGEMVAEGGEPPLGEDGSVVTEGSTEERSKSE